MMDESALYEAYRTRKLPVTVVGGVPGARLACEEWGRLFVAIAKRRARGAEPAPYFSSFNGETISRCRSSAEIRALFEASDGLAADGMPGVVASRWLTRSPLPERAATTDLFHVVARLAERTGTTFYMLGASPEQNRGAVDNVRRLYPELDVVGAHHGYFTPDEEPGLVAEIDRLAPDIVWVAMGVPREQQFCIRNRGRLGSVGLLKTCGGLFDFLSGKNSRAPLWMQNAGLEWLYRLGLEPRRLFWRYAVTNVHAAWLLLTRTTDRIDMTSQGRAWPRECDAPADRKA